MIKIYTELFSELNSQNVDYCSWKSNHALVEFLEGDGDIDLYVSYPDKNNFEVIISELGFIEGVAYVNKIPFVKHFLIYDEESGKIAHIHVYYKIITGESNSKNYLLPLDSWIKENSNSNTSINKLNDSAQLVIFLIRYYLKIASPLGLALYFRDKSKYLSEWDSLKNSTLDLSITPCFLRKETLSKMHTLFISGSNSEKFIFAQKVKLELSGLARRSLIKHLYFKVSNTILRAANKLFIKRKKTLDNGLLICICGLDGTGKTTAVEEIHHWLSKQLTVKKIHIGRPSPTIMTFPFWIVLRGLERLRHGSAKNKKEVVDFLPKKNISTLNAFRYALLAYERLTTYKAAVKLTMKGYIVLSDRFPSYDHGKMDSPRVIEDENRSRLYNMMYKYENHFYNQIGPSDLSFYLSVPVETAIERNNLRNKAMKETDNEMIARYQINQNLNLKSDQIIHIDATKSIQNVQNKIKQNIWQRFS